MPINLGAAVGRVTIDFSDLNNVTVATQQVARQAEQNLGRVDAASRRTQQGFAGVGAAARSMAGALGISLGIAGIVQLGRMAVAAEEAATAYRRQSVAALHLAGSQDELNSLLAAYEDATGGAVDKGTALADVTRLMATGFADNAADLTRFVTIARGASLAMGRSSEYIISQLQLAIANQSTMRLDQIGIGVDEFNKRLDEMGETHGDLSTEMRFQVALLDLMEEKFGALAKSAEANATGTERARKAFKDLRMEMAQDLSPGIDQASNDMADFINWIRKARTEYRRLLNVGLEHRRSRQGIVTLPSLSASTLQSPGDVPFSGFGGSGAGAGGPRFDRDQTALIREWSDGVQAIERDANAARLDEVRSFEESQASTVRSYQLSRSREAEDFARSRARAEAAHLDMIADVRRNAAQREAMQIRDMARMIADARADSAERIAEAEEQRAEKIADARADSQERLVEMEEDYQRDRERAAAGHRDTLIAAASRLDARAVAQEQRRYNTERAQAAEAHTEKVADEKESLQKAIAQANDAYQEQVENEAEALAERIEQAERAHQRQLEDARAADEQRIQDMEEDFAERKALEDEDRAIRLERARQDHQEALAEQARQHALALQQIEEQKAEERAELDKAFQKALGDAKLQTDEWYKLQERRNEMAIELFDEWFAHINRAITRAAGAEFLGPTQFPAGALPGPVSQSSAGFSRVANVTVEQGAIQVNGVNDPVEVGRIVRGELLGVMRELAE